MGTLVLAAALMAPAVASAQDHSAFAPPRSWLVPGFDRMPGGTRHGALPKIGLPLPPIGLPPRVDPDALQRHRRRVRYLPQPVVVVMAPQYAVVAPVVVAPAPEPVKQIASQGSLVLHVKPDNTDVFVDGYYVGAAVDLGGDRGGTFLEEGPHRIDLSASGYEAVTFDVRIAPNQSIVLRRELKQLQAPSPAPPKVSPPTTFYLIPGCYAGSVPPKDARLPSTCEISRTLVIQN